MDSPIKRIFSGIALLLLLNAFQAKASAYGLRFSGMESTIENRTSLDIFGRKKVPPVFRDSLVIDFTFCNYPSAPFGYILRVKDHDNPSSTWNLSYNGRADTLSFRLNEEGRYSLVMASIPKEELGLFQWTPMKVTFNLRDSSVALKIGQKEYQAKSDILPSSLKPHIQFGKSDHMIDVPSFAIRDLRISGREGNDYSFPLDEASGKVARSRKRPLLAKVENPIWLIGEAMSWKQVARLPLRGLHGTAWNPDTKEVLVYDRERLTRIGLLDDNIREEDFAGACPVSIDLGSNFLSEDGSKLYTYEAHSPDRVNLARLDLATLQWAETPCDGLPMQIHHHCSFYDSRRGSHVIFGGFGDSYYNGTFYEMTEDSGNWAPVWQDVQDGRVSPRYFTSCGTDPNTGDIFIFGGMGNDCGEQVVGRQYYYDLHRVDPVTGASELLWTLDWDLEDMVPVRHLIVDGDSFYTLCYPEYKSDSSLQLFRFSLKDGTRERLCDPIPINSDEIHTYSDLYYDDYTDRLVAILYETTKDLNNSVRVCTLAFPPRNAVGKIRNDWRILALFLFFALLAVAVTAIGDRRRKKAQQALATAPSRPERKRFRPVAAQDSIMLFGEFCATGKDGRDISYMFSTQLRQLFILLLKHQATGGLQPRTMSNLLWPDKDEEKAKNSRGVAINHLRKVLEEFDGVSLSYSDGLYKLETSAPFYCDYLAAAGALGSGDSETVLCCASRGPLLQFDKESIWDSFKETFDSKAIPLLQSELEKRYQAKKYPEVEEVAEILLSMDPFDEMAIDYEVKALRRQNRHEDAIVRRAAFDNEFKKAYEQ